jgi:hypothetical protein
MTISTYQELRDAIQSWTKRSDTLSQLDTFIDMAESMIWSVLRVREMEHRTTLSTSTASRFVDLPDDYVKMRQLMITIDDVLFDLEMVPLKNMNISDWAAVPCQFTVTSQIELNCVSDQVYTLEIDYFRELEPLSASEPVNDVLLKFPMIYLSACLHYAFEWQLKEDKAQYWENQFTKHVAAANRKARNGRFGPAPAMRINKGMVV